MGRSTMRTKRIAVTVMVMACGIMAMGGVLMGHVTETRIPRRAPAAGDVRIVMDRNSGAEATRAFRFANVPSPVKDDAATKASLAIVDGEVDGNSAVLSALTDGILPAGEDEPDANFFFEQGTWGGRFRMDFASVIEIAQINSYSWHPNTRGPQAYKVYGSDESEANFNAAPNADIDPANCGWKLIASVDTRTQLGENGGQYGVSVSGGSGSLGKFKYLLFSVFQTEVDDEFGNTFYSEIDVIAKK
jgi:hypothetical protein